MVANDRRWLQRGDQAICALLVAVTIATVACKTWRDSPTDSEAVEWSREISHPLQVDVNEAPWPELALLPGIGPTLAKRIIWEREHRGPFRAPSDLARVRGIGPVTLSRIRPHVYCGPATTLSQDQSIARSRAGAE